MNSITNNRFKEIEKFIAYWQGEFEKNPSSIAAKIGLENWQHERNEFLAELSYFKNRHGREVIEIHLNGPVAIQGSLPMLLLSNLTHSFGKAFCNISYYTRKGKSPGSIFPRELAEIINLRFSGVEAGSTVLFATADTNPDILGFSLAENTLSKTFRLLKSRSEDNLHESVAAIGSAGAQELYKFMSGILKNQLDITLRWTDAQMESYEWKGSRHRLISLIQSLERFEQEEPIYETMRGHIHMLLNQGRIGITLDQGGKKFINFDSSMISAIEELHINEKVAIDVQTVVTRNKTTGRKKPEYFLRALKKHD